MKTFWASLTVLLCCFLLTGAVGFDAPLMPSSDFYVNDHAGVIERQERAAMQKTALEIYEKTGVRAVVLATESFDGLEPKAYAESIFNSWQLGEAYGAVGAKGVLILFCEEERDIAAITNTDIPMESSLEAADKLIAEGKLGQAVSGCFFETADNIYGMEKINGGARAVFIGAEGLSYNGDEESAQKPRSTQASMEKQERSKGTYLMVTVGISALIILNAVMTHKKAAVIAKSTFYNGRYQRSEYKSLMEMHDYDDYPSGFGGAGNRKAIYGEDVDEADDICIIKRVNNGEADTQKHDGSRDS